MTPTTSGRGQTPLYKETAGGKAILSPVDTPIPLEAAIVGRIVKYLNRRPATWLINVHGSGMGRVGVPDIIGCQHGRMFALEVKRPRVGVASAKQKYELMKLANAGALAAIVESLEDVQELGL